MAVASIQQRCATPPLDEFGYNLDTGKFIVLTTNFDLY